MLDFITKNYRFIYLFISFETMVIMVNYSFLTHECQETQIENPFDSILGFGLVKDYWEWKKLSLKKDIFTKDFQRTHIIKVSWW